MLQTNPNHNPALNKRSAGNLKRTCIHLRDADRTALAIIKAEYGWPSDALTVRQALRFLAKRLTDPKVLADNATEKSHE
jgi:hypothetical protein